jgi:hypothetical protein
MNSTRSCSCTGTAAASTGTAQHSGRFLPLQGMARKPRARPCRRTLHPMC